MVKRSRLRKKGGKKQPSRLKKEKTISREEFIDKALEKGYNFADVQEFAIDHFQNLNSMQQNLKDLDKWVKSDISRLNKNYYHLSLKELKEDLKRVKAQHESGDFMSEEIFDIENEIEERERLGIKGRVK